MMVTIESRGDSWPLSAPRSRSFIVFLSVYLRRRHSSQFFGDFCRRFRGWAAGLNEAIDQAAIPRITSNQIGKDEINNKGDDRSASERYPAMYEGLHCKGH